MGRRWVFGSAVAALVCVAALARPAAAAEPSPREVAELYVTVGRELKTLQQQLGDDATYDLWPRYRYINIISVLRAPPACRGKALTMLDQLRVKIRDRAPAGG